LAAIARIAFAETLRPAGGRFEGATGIGASELVDVPEADVPEEDVPETDVPEATLEAVGKPPPESWVEPASDWG
jgi:hypothetical protein